MVHVRRQRFRGIQQLLEKYPDPTLPLRNLKIAQEVWSRTIEYDFPFISDFSVEMSIFKACATPSISKILAATKQLTGDTHKRIDDTSLLLCELHDTPSRRVARALLIETTNPKTSKPVERLRRATDPSPNPLLDPEELQEQGNDEARTQATIDRINWIHSHYRIPQEDYTYNLALFILEVLDWIDRFEWRKTTDLEKNAVLAVWTATGEKLGIENIPSTVKDLREWTENYERVKMVYASWNPVVAESVIKLSQSTIPFPTPYGLVRRVLISFLPPRVCAALGYKAPATYMVWMTKTSFWLRSRFVRYFMLPRTVPLVRTALRAAKEEAPVDIKESAHEVDGVKSGGACPFSQGHKRYIPRFDYLQPSLYSKGYRIDELGPARFARKDPTKTSA
ncbi:hypothetical protein BG011_004584 [Mortierella polycephala]|uniref:ER-bound oxygenase mpaB/mpaB'/Rubber oxygenase catalytic domain-containing protein n=1 Tax=Mortierella polycephala TaxID=41804 RepID=A0A9P6Q1C2_9FUNG|nr:hypothetical protein BG011_004584 [Mortierella polycephala]